VPSPPPRVFERPTRAESLAVEWRAPSAAISRLVRAADRVFVAHTRLAGERLHVAGVTAPRAASPPLAPGVLHVDPARERLLVGTGDTPLELTRLGVRSGYELARARGIRSGARFEPP